MPEGGCYGQKQLSSVKQRWTTVAILQRIVDGLVFIDNSQSGFVPERHYRTNIFGSTNAGEMPNCEQTLLLALEKAFISAPRICIWWELRQLCYSGSKNQCVNVCVVMVTAKSLRWMLGSTMALYLVLCSSSLCWRHCRVCFALGLIKRISMPIILSSLLNRWRNMSGGSWYRKYPWGEGVEG